MNSAKKQKEAIGWDRLEISSRKLEIPREHFMQEQSDNKDRIKDGNGKNLTEAEATEKRWQEYTELYKKGLNDPDNHSGVVTHLEPDILKSEVRWALGSITTNKTSGGDRVPAELFKILRDDNVKVLRSIYQQIWKTEQWPQD